MRHIFVLLFTLFSSSLLFSQSDSTKKSVVKPPASFFVGAGASFNSFAVTGSDSYYETQIDHHVPVSVAFIIGAKLYTDNRVSRFFLAPRMSIFSFSAKGEVELTSGLSEFSHSSSYKSGIVFNPSANVGYDFIKKPGFKWHVSGGIGLYFLTNPNETQTTNYPNATTRTIENKPDPMIFVFSTGTGFDIGKNITIWMNYFPPADISKYINKKSRLSSLQAGAGWTFNKRK